MRQKTRAACRLARTNAQASVDRARSEPVRGQAEVELGTTVLAHTHRFIHAMLSVDAVRLPVREAGGLPELADFLAVAGELLDAARAAVLSGSPPARGAGSAAAPGRVRRPARRRPRAGSAAIETAATLVEATDRMTNSLDTLLAELRRQRALTSDR